MSGDAIANDIAAVGRIGAVPTILDVICRTTGMGFAAIARVTEDRWVACSVKDDIAFGLQPGGELKLETTICNEIRQHRQPVVIDHVAEDGRFHDHHTPAMYGFQSYISMPILLADGSFFGTLCAIDPRPARLDKPEVIGMFRLFAELIAFHLDALDTMANSHAVLTEEKANSALREQFVAVLGHDLRNPLAAIQAGMRLIEREPLSAKASGVVALIKQSTERMATLIDNVMDFARGRLGDGIPLDRRQDASVRSVLDHVVAELRVSHPDRRIETGFGEIAPMRCDPGRLSQLFSNLIGNALTHGAVDKPVTVHASTEDDRFTFSVSNAGDPIAANVIDRLFGPFSRGEVRPGQAGLGLGLYIASEIARGHGGRIDVLSNAEETRFTFTMPIR